ncbi:hypothetical protein FRB99_005811 [Tulasnella sp. 403]|nr:hypothetical protein FRB99_005811 [Tulasnella sp. 403]
MTSEVSLKDLLEKTSSWQEAAEIVRTRQRIPDAISIAPDLDSIDGLQKVNSRYTKHWAKLKELWLQKDEDIMGAICVLFGKMSKDVVLRSKLAQSGAITLLVDAMDRPRLRLLIMRALSVMTHHGGLQERIAVADKAAAKIVSIALETPTDDPLFTLCVTVLCHSSYGVYSVDVPTSQRNTRTREADARPLLELMVRASKLPDEHTSGHAFNAVTMLTVMKNKDIHRNPEACRCLVGHLRHDELATRIDALRSIFTLYKDSPPETVQVDPMRAVKAYSKIKHDSEYAEEIMKTGIQNSALANILTASRDCTKAMMQNLQDRDMLKLGKTLYSLLMQSEWGIGDGRFEADDGLPFDTGVPYKTWFESLPFCISALRAENPQSEAATMLEIKYHIRHRRFSKAHEIAKKWIDNVNAECSYCYYALAMDCKDDREGLRWAKKGLRTRPTGYIRLGMLYNAVVYAGALGIDMLNDHKAEHENPETHVVEAVAYLQSSLVDTKTFMELAPVDERLLRAVLTRYFCLFVAIKGPSLVDAKLYKLEPLMKRLKFVERISELIWSPVVQTQPRLTWMFISKHYEAAAKEWDEIFKTRREESTGLARSNASAQAAAEQDPPDGLQDLVESLCGGPKSHVNHDEDSWHRHILHPRLDESMLQMYVRGFAPRA